MASKRKYQGDEQSISSPPTKAAKTEITRSGRVRKKPSKFADDVVSDDTAIAKSPTTAATPRMETAHPAAPVVQVQSPKSRPSVKPETKPKPEPVVTMVTVPLIVPLAVSEPIDDSSKTPGRAGRARKKSAKVLEMEEFEEAEKKQVTKKTPNTEPNKKAVTPASDTIKKVASHMALTATSQPTKKSQKNLEFDASQGSAPITTKLLASPPSGVKIMDITTSPTQEPVMMISPRIVAKTAGITKSPVSVDELASEQAGKGSVIKLLLSSPSQSTGPVVSTTSFNQGSSSVDKTPQKKKSKAKSKTKLSPDALGHMDPYVSSPLKVGSPMIKLSPGSDELVQAKSLSQTVEPLTVDTTLTMAAMSPTTEAKDGLKMKILLSPTQKTTHQKLLTKALTSPVKVDKVVTAKNVVKESKPKKNKKTSQSEKDTFLAPSLPTPVVHVPIDISNIGIQAAHEATVVVSGKKKSGKATPYKEKAPMDTSPMMDDEYGLDLSEITLGEPGDDALMQIDDDNGLMISEEEVMETPKPKPVKKKAKAKTGGKKDLPRLGDVSNTVVGNSLVMDFEKMKSEDKQKKKMKEPPEPDKNKKKRAPTAYMLWCTSHRTRVVKDNPGIDFSTVSKTLGEMWSGLPEKEKMMWKRKAKKAAGKGSTIITTGKAHQQASKQMLQPVATARHATTPKPAPALSAAIMASDESLVSPAKGFGIEPIDAAAHLKILGESLGIIGMKLQEHRGLIAVQGSLSVLLDTILCALGPLMCLTAQLPETDACSHETHMKTLDNIAYFMPGL